MTMMNRVIVVTLAALVIAGCAASDPGLDDVADQESAVESAPAPEPEPTPVPAPGDDDLMKRWREACYDNCDERAADQWYGCHHNAACEEASVQEQISCTIACYTIFQIPLVGDAPAPEGFAVDSVPTADEDMRVIRDACEAKCDIGGTVCHNNCRPSDGLWCDDNCEGDQDICRGQCSVDFPGLVGEQAPTPTSEEEEMRIRILNLTCHHNCAAVGDTCVLLYCHGQRMDDHGNPTACSTDCNSDAWQCMDNCDTLWGR